MPVQQFYILKNMTAVKLNEGEEQMEYYKWFK